MGEKPGDLEEDRALTDASLGAERAGADAATDRALAHAQRRLDNLIERDRFLADDRLVKSREKADRLIEIDRLASPSASKTVEHERETVDQRIGAERDAADSLLERERERVDTRSEETWRELDQARAKQEVQREDTDARLFDERSGTDHAVAALERITSAPAASRADGQSRHDGLAMVAHDLRSPLTIITLNAALLIEDTTEEATREAAEDILGAATRMGRLLEDLFEVVRIESGTLRLVKDVHDIGALLTEVLRSYRPLFEGRAIRFSIEMPATELPVPFDHDRVVQLLSNLLSNALKFTPTGGVVELHAEHREGEVVLVMRNTGQGIDPQAMVHVFERFWKVDGSPHQGLGLGLYICKCIAEAHGGSISIESTPGEGVEFRVTLPTQCEDRGQSKVPG